MREDGRITCSRSVAEVQEEGQGKMVWTTGEEYEGGWKNNLQQVSS